jgi:hypothetical protein
MMLTLQVPIGPHGPHVACNVHFDFFELNLLKSKLLLFELIKTNKISHGS